MRRFWNRWKFYLSALVLVAPAAMVPSFLSGAPEELGQRVLPAREIGPWTVTLAESSLDPPKPRRVGAPWKDYAARFCEGCMEEIRAAYLHVGERPGIDAAGAPLHGSPYHLHAHVAFPETLRGHEALWLTVDGWDGRVHQISWPLSEVVAEAVGK